MTEILESLQSCIEALSATNSNLDKVAVLREFPQVRYLLGVILDKHKKSGVTRPALEAYKRTKFPRLPDRLKRFPTDVSTMLDWLIARKVTGDDAKEMVWTVVERFPAYQDLILKIADKDLKTRLGQALYDQAFGSEDDAKAKYSPALAFDIEKQMSYFQKSIGAGDRWFLSRKIDGVRCQIHTTHPVVCKSRNGNVFKSLVHLNELVAKHVPQGFVLDCEISVIHPDGSESFSEAVGAVKRSEPMLRFHCVVFDILTQQEFESGTSMQIFSERYNRSPKILKPATDHCLPHQKISLLMQVPYSDESFQEWQDKVEEFGWEGLMLRRDVEYEGKRTKNLLKVKKFFTEEYVIEDLKYGPFRIIDPNSGKETTIETVTAVGIRHKGFPVSVGSGFTLAQRQEMFDHPKKYMGKTIAVQYFEETQTNGALSLRFPTFKHFYGGKRDV